MNIFNPENSTQCLISMKRKLLEQGKLNLGASFAQKDFQDVMRVWFHNGARGILANKG